MTFHFINSEKFKEYLKEINLSDLKNSLEGQNFPVKSEIDSIYGRSINKALVNVVFVTNIEIKALNKEWRSKAEATDVLSFNINEPELLGELYVSLEYISQNYSRYEKSPILEFIRDIIHGTLHLCGYDHKIEFVKNSEDNYTEEMFEVQETLLEEVLKKLEIRN